MSQITPVISINPAQYAELQALLNPANAEKATRAAVSKTLNKSYRLIVKELSATLYIDQNGITGDPSRPNFTGHNDGLSAILSMHYNPTRAIKFRTVSPRTRLNPQRKGGVRVLFTRGRGPITFRKGFIGKARFHKADEADGIGTTDAVFVRYGIKVKGKKQKIKQVYGPSIIGLMTKEQLTALGRELLEASAEIFKTQMLSQIDRFLRRKKIDRPEVSEISFLR
jgi:hypothetical protein